MPIPVGRYTRKQIRDLALNRAGNRRLDADATAWLAQLLFDLYTLYDWPFLWASTTVTLTGPTFGLPGDYLSSQDDESLVITAVDGMTQGNVVVAELDRTTFESLGTQLSSGPVPRFWHADLADGVGLLAPNPTGHTIAATLRYKFLPAEVDAANEPTEIPMFPWHSYLVQALYVLALEHEKDGRALQEAAVRDQMFQQIRRGWAPRNARQTTIPLDGRVFRVPFQGD